MDQALYLVAYLPDEPVAQQVWDYKQYIAEMYGSMRGLKVLPHVTFISPFSWPEADEEVMAGGLSELMRSFTAETIYFNGFNHFKGPKSYTIYVAVERSPLMEEQHARISVHARNKLLMPASRTGKHFTPHMTVAYRDLDHHKFTRAWPHFENMPFHATGQLDRLWLLKHNGTRWEPLKELMFRSTGGSSL